MILEICNQGINDFWGINTSDLILEVFILVPFSLGLKRYYREQQFKRSEYFFNLRSIYKGHEDYNSLRSLLKERNKDNVKYQLDQALLKKKWFIIFSEHIF
jgi:hypothetical protein